MAEGAGEDAFLGAAFARARVAGFQGNGSLAANDSMIACLKHYAVRDCCMATCCQKLCMDT